MRARIGQLSRRLKLPHGSRVDIHLVPVAEGDAAFDDREVGRFLPQHEMPESELHFVEPEPRPYRRGSRKSQVDLETHRTVAMNPQLNVHRPGGSQFASNVGGLLAHRRMVADFRAICRPVEEFAFHADAAAHDAFAVANATGGKLRAVRSQIFLHDVSRPARDQPQGRFVLDSAKALSSLSHPRFCDQGKAAASHQCVDLRRVRGVRKERILETVVAQPFAGTQLVVRDGKLLGLADDRNRSGLSRDGFRVFGNACEHRLHPRQHRVDALPPAHVQKPRQKLRRRCKRANIGRIRREQSGAERVNARRNSAATQRTQSQRFQDSLADVPSHSCYEEVEGLGFPLTWLTRSFALHAWLRSYRLAMRANRFTTAHCTLFSNPRFKLRDADRRAIDFRLLFAYTGSPGNTLPFRRTTWITKSSF